MSDQPKYTRKSPRSSLPYLLILLSLLEAGVAFKLGTWGRLYRFTLAPLIGYTAFSTFVVSVCSLFQHIDIFGKSEDGSVDPIKKLICAPYTYFYRFVIYAHRAVIRHEPVATRFAPGFYLSGWFDRAEHARRAFDEYTRAHGQTAKPADSRLAVLDLTCELPRVVYDPKVIAEYICVPTFDRCSPSAAKLEMITRWVMQHRNAGREVVIHCAFGHGRSATCLVASMLVSGVAKSISEAEEILRRERPLVELTSIQIHTLNEWLTLFHPELEGAQYYKDG